MTDRERAAAPFREFYAEIGSSDYLPRSFAPLADRVAALLAEVRERCAEVAEQAATRHYNLMETAERERFVGWSVVSGECLAQSRVARSIAAAIRDRAEGENA